MTDSEQPTRCVIYAAKSTDDKRGSLETQIAACEQHATRNGWIIDGEPHKDESKSGYRQSRGPDLVAAKSHAALLAKEGAGEVVLLVADTDRLARGDAIQAAHLVEHVLDAVKSGYRIESVTQNLGGEMGLLLAAVYGERAHADSKAKSGHVRRGVRSRVEQGHMHGGYRPYGFAWERDRNDESDMGRLVEVPEQVAVVRRIFASYESGKSQGAIAAELNEDGIAPPRAARWDRSTIALMLRNRTYIGEVKHLDEWFGGRHEPILDRATWDRVQARLAVRRQQLTAGLGRPPNGRHLLVGGILRCGICGGAMRARTYRPKQGREPNEVYLCTTRHGYKGGQQCSMPSVPRHLVDGALLEHFEMIGLDAEKTRRQLTSHAERAIVEAQALQEAAERESAQADARLARVRRAFQDAKIDADDYQSHRVELEAEKQAAEAEHERWCRRVDELQGAASAIDTEAEWLARLDEMRKVVEGRLAPGKDLDALRAGIASYFREIRLEPDGKDEDGEDAWALVCRSRKIEWTPTDEEAEIIKAVAEGRRPIADDEVLPGPRVGLNLEPRRAGTAERGAGASKAFQIGDDNSETSSALSAGSNALLRLGAIPLTRSDDVLEQLGVDAPTTAAARPDGRAAVVLARLEDGAASADELVRATRLDPAEVAAALVELELAGLAAADAGVYRGVVRPG